MNEPSCGATSELSKPAQLLCMTAGSREVCNSDLKQARIEMLARLAALMAGKDPDQRATIRYGDVVAFDDVVWRYPDFLTRAEAAYVLLESDELPEF